MSEDLLTTLRRITTDIGTLALLGCEHSPAHLNDDCVWTCRGCELLDRAWAVSDHEAYVAEAVRHYIQAVGRLIRDALETAGIRDDAPWPEIRAVAQEVWGELPEQD